VELSGTLHEQLAAGKLDLVLAVSAARARGCLRRLSRGVCGGLCGFGGVRARRGRSGCGQSCR
ncbi:hypothetical protein, partial [Streptomyces coeruleorubidus]|uniref:hypothetical protein n=1 Tax=Streptomyces coeruleorubidus TaxID=116188 RepID=UPI0033D0F225